MPKRVGAIALVLVLVLAVVGVGVGIYTYRRPIPTTSGTIDLAIFDSEVEIHRDARSVPTILADSDADLMRAQGYVHAQDRFFEMDYRRHVTSGRLAELVGNVEAAIQADVVTRTFGWRHVAEQEWSLISPESRALLTAYTEGVNAYLAAHEASELGMEYTVLGLAVQTPVIEKWTPVDSLAWLKAMAWDLRNNYDEELFRASAYQALGDVMTVDELFPDYPTAEHAPIVSAPGSATGGAHTNPVAEDRDGARSPGHLPAPRHPIPPPGPQREGETERDREATAHSSEIPPSRGAPPTDAASLHELLTGDDAAGVGIDAALQGAAAALGAVPQLMGVGEGVGSNSFVLSGEHTSTGQPILANDPHLGVSQPGIWHQVGLKCRTMTDQCTFDVSGFSLAGLPGVVIGHNADLAWGLTNTGADVTDFYLERLTGEDTYLRGSEDEALKVRTETIDIAGAEPVELTIRETVHGPIISDVLEETETVATLPVPAGSPSAGSGYVVSLAWTALIPGTSMDAIFAIDRARTAQDVAEAAAHFEVPAQNIVWASSDGDIGYQMPGKIPVRGQVSNPALPADGTWPRPGWDASYDWLDFLQGADLPSVVNPPEGFIVAANQAIQTPGTPPFVGSDFDYGFRSQRLRNLIQADIESGARISPQRAEEYMLDDLSAHAQLLVPAILALDIDDPFVRDAVEELRRWQEDGLFMSADSPGAAYFASVWAHLMHLTFDDDLPVAARPDGGSRWLQIMVELLQDPQSEWWDDRATVNIRETRDEILTRALEKARFELTNTQGKDPSRWRWGALHQLAPTHPIFGGDDVPAALRWLMNPTPQAASGGSSIVNATGWSPTLDENGRADYTVRTAPSMRMVVDFSDLDSSTWVNLTGVSGHAASPHYDDQMRAWANGEYFPWPFSLEAIEEAAQETLVLRPKSAR